MMRKNRETTDDSDRQVKVLPIIPGISLIALGVIAVFLVAVFIMSRFGIIKLPEFIDNLINPNAGETKTENSPWDELISAIGGKEENTVFSIGDADYSSVSLSTVFPEIRPENYFQLFALAERSGATERKTEIAAMYSGECVRFTSYADGQAEKSVIYDGRKVKVTDSTGSRVFSADEAYIAAFPPEGEVGLPSFDKLGQRLKEYEAGGKSITVMYDSVNCTFRVSVFDDGTGIKEEYDVRADLGVVLSCRLFSDNSDIPYYELTTTALLTSVEYTDEQFVTD